jgi:hypothetical protein
VYAPLIRIDGNTDFFTVNPIGAAYGRYIDWFIQP